MAVVVSGVAVAGASTPSDPATQVVDAFGYAIEVPTAWPVIDLTASPTTCVRVDRNAVYLGHPGAEQDCPPEIRGSADAILVEPLAGSVARSTGSVQADAGQPIPRGPSEDDANQIDLVVPDAAVRVTATFGGTADTVRGILAGATLTASGAQPTSQPVPAPAVEVMPSGAQAAAPAPAAPFLVRPPVGRGFDTCGLPTTSTMGTWKQHSSYKVAALYLGGRNWGCRAWSAVPTPSWLSSVASQGWQVLPIWVGWQAADDGTRCYHCAQMSSNTTTAWGQGRDEATLAAAAAGSAGFAPGSYLAYDMEGWDTSNASANAAELAFLSGWTTTIHAKGYKSAVYTSSCSGGATITSARGKTGPYGSGGKSGTFVTPDMMWFASWISSVPTKVQGISCIPDASWSGRPVGWQYRGAANETYGGKTINVDANLFAATEDPTKYVQGVYRVLLRRPADSGGTSHWVAFLSGGGSRSTFINSLVTSAEYTRNTVAQDYLQILHRNGDSSGIAYWANRLASGRRNDVILANLAGSAEYFKGVSKGDTQTFVSNLYLDLLGRGIDSSGLAYWSGKVDAGSISRYGLALTIADSTEAARRLVTAQYLIVLGRTPDGGGLDYWSKQYQSTHDILALVINLASSAEGYAYLGGRA